MGKKWNTQQREQKAIEALQMRLRGVSFGGISEQLECAKSTAHDLVSEELDRTRPHADYDKYRARQLAELESARTACMKSLELLNLQPVPQGVRDIVLSLCKIHEQETKIVGLEGAPYSYDAIKNMTDEELRQELDQIVENFNK